MLVYALSRKVRRPVHQLCCEDLPALPEAKAVPAWLTQVALTLALTLILTVKLTLTLPIIPAC